jgi:predicted XRE-type DNA-binding protein
MRRGKPTNPEIRRLKSKLIAIILREIVGLSVRQAEYVTGLRALIISRLRRGLNHDFLLDALLGAAMNIGVHVQMHVGKPPPRRFPTHGREGTRRPKTQ